MVEFTHLVQSLLPFWLLRVAVELEYVRTRRGNDYLPNALLFCHRIFHVEGNLQGKNLFYCL